VKQPPNLHPQPAQSIRQSWYNAVGGRNLQISANRVTRVWWSVGGVAAVQATSGSNPARSGAIDFPLDPVNRFVSGAMVDLLIQVAKRNYSSLP
jgi:hypothetical protein